MGRHSVIIVAGGSGSRMNTEIPKQFLEVAGKPVLVHTIGAFLDFDPEIELILVLPKAHVDTWERIRSQYFPDKSIIQAEGGATRFQSVGSGLQLVTSELVAIHDAVRPCITLPVIQKSFESAAKFGSGLVTVPLKDSIRELVGNTSEARDRSRFRAVQTPQTFQTKLIRRAFEMEEKPTFTDDATVFEAAGNEVALVEGSYQNIKITTIEDLSVAELFLQTKNSKA